MNLQEIVDRVVEVAAQMRRRGDIEFTIEVFEIVENSAYVLVSGMRRGSWKAEVFKISVHEDLIKVMGRPLSMLSPQETLVVRGFADPDPLEIANLLINEFLK